MCYSALIKAEYRRYVREYGAVISLQDYVELFVRRVRDGTVKIPRAMEIEFLVNEPASEGERRVREAIVEHTSATQTRLEAELFTQRTRLNAAERVLASARPTKAAAEHQRIASAKVEAIWGRLAALQRLTGTEDDSRIFPGSYAPVMVWEDGRRAVKPMRYQCRPEGKPAHYDRKFPGTYNARRDNLGGFWRGLFGHRHGLLLIDAFYEHVDRDGRDVVLAFRPQTLEPMLVACLWSHWHGPDGEELLSFAAITDDPPPEVAAAGHDRCVIPIKSEHIDAWLRPDPRRLDVQQAILDDRWRPVYEHRLAA
jgi:putative SOS response-associated peptidase YedK